MMSWGKISAQPHTIVKQICFPNGNVLFLSLFSLCKNWMHNVEWGCAEFLPELVYNSSEVTDELDDSVIENLYESDCESEFEGFVVDRHRTF